MREYELEVLEQYDMEVKGTRKIRGAFFCDTSEGVMILKETRVSEKRAAIMYIILSRLESEKNLKVDTPVFSRDGALVVSSREGRKYMLKKWFAGRECDMKRGRDCRCCGDAGWAAQRTALERAGRKRKDHMSGCRADPVGGNAAAQQRDEESALVYPWESREERV